MKKKIIPIVAHFANILSQNELTNGYTRSKFICKWYILIILLAGIIFRLFLTEDGNFIFNMDNGRDMVDVREMVILKKLRLTGPNTPIEGVYDGPFWYYLLAIPFIITSGDPYGSILMQIILWAIGGFYLLNLTYRFGILAFLSVGFLWISSNFIVLASLYAFNPNPVIFLTPLLIFLIEKYITSQKLRYAAMMWFLAGLFFNFEMNFGVFVPLIIILAIFISKKNFLFKDYKFWIGAAFFLFCLLPQIIFDLRHQFIMLNGLIYHLNSEGAATNFLKRFYNLANIFYFVYVPTVLNVKPLATAILIISIPIFFNFFYQKKRDLVVIIALMFIITPLVGYLFLPVAVNPWHFGGEMVAVIILVGFIIFKLWQFNLGKIFSLGLSLALITYSALNVLNFFMVDRGKPNMDPSVLRNKLLAIDFVYKYANGKNFKVYTYLPSVYDYPYQYLIWWYGLQKFGFLPEDYAYAPNKPQYIPGKASFSLTQDQQKLRENSNLVFLIKEPDRNYTRFGWEGEFVKLESIEKQMIGPFEIEVKRQF
ncbi:glycosyltransferase family 39 protein [Candidatus Daviesbacteria bacterium]|nr:glycosyltransferase family 39 protein [Candidatus Daviesbacteria bacterium]